MSGADPTSAAAAARAGRGATAGAGASQRAGGTVTLTDQPVAWRPWLADLRAHAEVFGVLARKDFSTRYKRASLGVVWAVAVPLLQGLVMAFVFSKVAKLGSTDGFGAYVLARTLPWTYFAATLSAATTSIVDGSGLCDKVWFPRLLLVGVPAASNVVGLLVSLGLLLVLLPLLGGTLGGAVLLLVPGFVVLVAFTFGLSLLLSALNVYFRDVRFLVQAALMVWLYATPILYLRDAELFGGLSRWFDLNPMSGVVALFQAAVTDVDIPLARPLAASLVATGALLAVGLEAQRRHDRLFVDQL